MARAVVAVASGEPVMLDFAPMIVVLVLCIITMGIVKRPKYQRRAALAYFFLFSGWLIFLGDRWTIGMISARYLGYALGAFGLLGLAEVAFLLLSGSFPFGGAGGIEQLLRRKLSGEVPSIRRLRPEVPRKVDSVLRRAMAPRPENRFQSAGEFIEELADALKLHEKEHGRWWRFRQSRPDG